MAHEIGAMLWMEVPLGRASTGAIVEHLVSGLALGAASQFDPFVQLRHHAMASSGDGKEAATTWHAPSAELCGALLLRSNLAASLTNAPTQAKEDNAKSYVLQ